MTNKPLADQMYYLVNNINIDCPKTIKLPKDLDNEQDITAAVRAWLFNYRATTNINVKLDIHQQAPTFNVQEQPYDIDLADAISNYNHNNKCPDNNYVEYALHCCYPANMLATIDYNCIKYFTPSSVYKTSGDVIDQEVFEYMMYYLPVSIYLRPINDPHDQPITTNEAYAEQHNAIVEALNNID